MGDAVLTTFTAPEWAVAVSRAGQFVNILSRDPISTDPILRRPYSVYRADEEPATTGRVFRNYPGAKAGGEHAWQMPIPEFMDERVLSSKVADLAQYDGVRWGGGLFAARFLQSFTGGLPWAHLDIAGPTFNNGGPTGHLTSGATGYGVATLVEYLRGLDAAAPSEPS